MTQAPTLDSDVAAFLDELARQEAPAISAGTVAEARANNAAFLREVGAGGPELAEVVDVEVPAADGPLGARWYRDDGPAPAVLVFLHGGGWVLGDLEGHDGLCRRLAASGAYDVLSVDYRLAPEHPFPAGLDDAFAAVRWVAGTAADGRPVVVAGDSSGGNLAAAVALRARDEGGPAIAWQVLLYPVLDRDLASGSYLRFGSGHLLTTGDMAWFFDQYVPDPAARDHPYVSPLRAADLSGVAPALVVVAGHDPLRDEGLAYAGRLAAAGVRVDVRCDEGMIHGYLTMPGAIPSTVPLIDEVVAEIRSRAGAPGHERSTDDDG